MYKTNKYISIIKFLYNFYTKRLNDMARYQKQKESGAKKKKLIVRCFSKSYKHVIYCPRGINSTNIHTLSYCKQWIRRLCTLTRSLGSILVFFIFLSTTRELTFNHTHIYITWWYYVHTNTHTWLPWQFSTKNPVIV